MLFIDLRKIMRTKRPVFLHDSGRRLHASFYQFFQQTFKCFGRFVLCRIKFFAGHFFNCIFVVYDSSCLYTDREAIYLAVDTDLIFGIIDPFFT